MDECFSPQDHTVYHTTKCDSTDQRVPFRFGMDSFNKQDRKDLGERLRLAMALIDSDTRPKRHSSDTCVKRKIDPPVESYKCENEPDPTNPEYVALYIKSLNGGIASNQCAQIEWLVHFDDLEGWRTSGCRHCCAWINNELGISLPLAWEYLRVGRKLKVLPIMRALFRSGRLTWSKVRILSRVATEGNESSLCRVAVDASATDVERLCNEYRWSEDEKSELAEEQYQAMLQYNARSLTWSKAGNGNTIIKISLPPDLAQAVLNSVESALEQTNKSNRSELQQPVNLSMSQRRADAAVIMAEQSLQFAGKDIAAADRYQVIVSVDAEELISDSRTSISQTSIHKKRASIAGQGAVAREAARRIACDCSISTIEQSDGEPINIGRKSRLWPSAMARAIKARDQHCQFPGCTQHQHLHIHHIQHWADGGSTSVENGVCLCSHHHRLVHEGGYVITKSPLKDKLKFDLLPTRNRFLFRSDTTEHHQRCDASF